MGDFKDLVGNLIDRFRTSLSQPAGWLIVWIGAAVCGTYFAKKEVPDMAMGHVALAAVLFATASTVILHFWTRPPVFRKSELGILFAIRIESDVERNRLSNDLIPQFSAVLAEHNYDPGFAVKALPEAYVNELTSDPDVVAITKRCRASFTVWGKLRTRKVKAIDTFVLTVQSLVLHSPTTKENQDLLRSEMQVVLPAKTQIHCEDDLNGLEFTSNMFAFGAMYVIAIAYFLSGQPTQAVVLLNDLRKRLNKGGLQSAGDISVLRRLTTKRLLDFIAAMNEEEFFQWRTGHDSERIKRIARSIDTAPGEWKSHLLLLSQRAMCHFVLNRNVAAAKALLQKCVSTFNNPDPALRYSQAFLNAYEGKLEEAENNYRTVFRTDGAESAQATPVEVEEFIAWIVELEPEKVQFYYFLGLINYRRKRDYAAADKDLRRFLELADLTNYAAQRKKATRWVEEIKAMRDKQCLSEDI